MKKIKMLSSQELTRLILPLLMPFLIIFANSMFSTGIERSILNKYLSFRLNIEQLMTPEQLTFFSNISQQEIVAPEEFKIDNPEDSEYLAYIAVPSILKPAVTNENKNEGTDTEEEKVDIGNPPEIALTSIYMGQKIKFATINGNVYKNGMMLDSEKIVKIEKDRIMLSGPWGKRWISVNY